MCWQAPVQRLAEDLRRHWFVARFHPWGVNHSWLHILDHAWSLVHELDLRIRRTLVAIIVLVLVEALASVLEFFRVDEEDVTNKAQTDDQWYNTCKLRKGVLYVAPAYIDGESPNNVTREKSDVNVESLCAVFAFL